MQDESNFNNSNNSANGDGNGSNSNDPSQDLGAEADQNKNNQQQQQQHQEQIEMQQKQQQTTIDAEANQGSGSVVSDGDGEQDQEFGGPAPAPEDWETVHMMIKVIQEDLVDQLQKISYISAVGNGSEIGDNDGNNNSDGQGVDLDGNSNYNTPAARNSCSTRTSTMQHELQDLSEDICAKQSAWGWNSAASGTLPNNNVNADERWSDLNCNTNWVESNSKSNSIRGSQVNSDAAANMNFSTPTLLQDWDEQSMSMSNSNFNSSQQYSEQQNNEASKDNDKAGAKLKEVDEACAIPVSGYIKDNLKRLTEYIESEAFKDSVSIYQQRILDILEALQLQTEVNKLRINENQQQNRNQITEDGDEEFKKAMWIGHKQYQLFVYKLLLMCPNVSSLGLQQVLTDARWQIPKDNKYIYAQQQLGLAFAIGKDGEKKLESKAIQLNEIENNEDGDYHYDSNSKSKHNKQDQKDIHNTKQSEYEIEDDENDNNNNNNNPNAPSGLNSDNLLLSRDVDMWNYTSFVQLVCETFDASYYRSKVDRKLERRRANKKKQHTSVYSLQSWSESDAGSLEDSFYSFGTSGSVISRGFGNSSNYSSQYSHGTGASFTQSQRSALSVKYKDQQGKGNASGQQHQGKAGATKYKTRQTASASASTNTNTNPDSNSDSHSWMNIMDTLLDFWDRMYWNADNEFIAEDGEMNTKYWKRLVQSGIKKGNFKGHGEYLLKQPFKLEWHEDCDFQQHQSALQSGNGYGNTNTNTNSSSILNTFTNSSTCTKAKRGQQYIGRPGWNEKSRVLLSDMTLNLTPEDTCGIWGIFENDRVNFDNELLLSETKIIKKFHVELDGEEEEQQQLDEDDNSNTNKNNNSKSNSGSCQCWNQKQNQQKVPNFLQSSIWETTSPQYWKSQSSRSPVGPFDMVVETGYCVLPKLIRKIIGKFMSTRSNFRVKTKRYADGSWALAIL